MYLFFVILSALKVVEVSCIGQETPAVNNSRHFMYNMYSYDKIYSLVLNETTEQILDFYEESDEYRGCPSRVHVSTADTITRDQPLFITATQQRGVSSWQLPLPGQSRGGVTARTLCPHDGATNMSTSVNRPLLHVTSSSPSNVSVDIKVRRVKDFYVELDKEVRVSATPATPHYYYFSFDSEPPANTTRLRTYIPTFNYTVPKSVILMIESEDDVCAIVSIQNDTCPVFDMEREVQYGGYHLTMSTLGGITLTQSMFPTGFFIVLIVKEKDGECTGASETDSTVPAVRVTERGDIVGDARNKTFRFRVVATISYVEYGIACAVYVALVIAFASLAAALAHCSCRDEVLMVGDEEPGVGAGPGPSSSTAQRDDGDAVPILASGSVSEGEEAGRGEGGGAPSLADLCRSRPDKQSQRNNMYFWSSLTVGVVYSLPVVQLLVTYQDMVLQTGDQDLCYYNFLCAHPLASLSDFNHVFSNVGYLILGVVFMLQVRHRQRTERRARQMEECSVSRGIPEQHGLFYSMGLALVMEGALSACYHLCPNNMNFQFDSSFMYVIAVLCMVKLYQNRHPDVNARAHATFLLIAAIMAIGVCGILRPSVAFWSIFTTLHLATCAILTLKIYYFGRLKLESGLASRAWIRLRSTGRSALVPAHTARAVLLAIANVANWALAAYGMYEHKRDLARHLLAVLMGNAILYTMFYMCMKLAHRERVPLTTWLYLLLAHLAWFTALAFFMDSRTKWSQTPAQSRRHNAVCTALQFYDTHDLWHLTSAAALFLSFNILLTVDDALRDTPRHKIPVF